MPLPKSADLVKRAAEVRATADAMSSPAIRSTMRDIASQYDELARQIDEIERLFGAMDGAAGE
jgi:hypothetical protein